MDPLTVFVASIVGAMIEEALRTRRGFAEYYPQSAAGTFERGYGWMKLTGRNVQWYVEPGQAVWIEARYLRPISGNIFDPDKLGAVGRAVRSADEPITFMASYGQMRRIDVGMVAESQAYRDYDAGDPFSTGDRDLDDWLGRREKKETDPDEDEEMEELLEQAVRTNSGDLGQWTASVRDGNHRTFGSVLGGETRVAIRLYDNDAQDVREAVRRKLGGEAPAWHDEASLDLLQKSVVDTGRLPDWLPLSDAIRAGLVDDHTGLVRKVETWKDGVLSTVLVDFMDPAVDKKFVADSRNWPGRRPPVVGDLVLSGGDFVYPMTGSPTPPPRKLLPDRKRSYNPRLSLECRCADDRGAGKKSHDELTEDDEVALEDFEDTRDAHLRLVELAEGTEVEVDQSDSPDKYSNHSDCYVRFKLSQLDLVLRLLSEAGLDGDVLDVPPNFPKEIEDQIEGKTGWEVERS